MEEFQGHRHFVEGEDMSAQVEPDSAWLQVDVKRAPMSRWDRIAMANCILWGVLSFMVSMSCAESQSVFHSSAEVYAIGAVILLHSILIIPLTAMRLDLWSKFIVCLFVVSAAGVCVSPLAATKVIDASIAALTCGGLFVGTLAWQPVLICRDLLGRKYESLMSLFSIVYYDLGFATWISFYMYIITAGVPEDNFQVMQGIAIAQLFGFVVAIWFIYHRRFSSQNWLNLIGSAIFLITTLAALFTLTFLYKFAPNSNQDSDFNATFTLCFVFLIALFVFFCLPLPLLPHSFQTKSLFTPFLGVFVPAMLFLSLYKNVPTASSYSEFFFYLAIAVPVVTVIFTMLSLTRNSNHTLTPHVWSSLACIGILFPVGFLVPMAYFSYISYTAAYICIAICGSIPFCFLINYCIQKKRKWRGIQELTSEPSRKQTWFCRPSAQNVTTLATVLFFGGFVIALMTLCYTVVLAPSGVAKGVVGSMIGVCAFAYICFHLICRIDRRLTALTAEERSEDERQQAKRQISLGYVAMVAIPAICLGLILLIGSNLDSTIRWTAGSFFAGFEVAILSAICLNKIRKLSAQFGNVLLWTVTTSCWWLMFLPFAVLIPSLVSWGVADNSSGSADLISSAVGIACFSLMFGVSLASIVVNYYFKRMEAEKRAKYTCFFLKKDLRHVGVRGDQEICRQIYDRYMDDGDLPTMAWLLEKQQITWRDVDKHDLDLRVSKELVSPALLARWERERQRQIEKEEEKQRLMEEERRREQEMVEAERQRIEQVKRKAEEEYARKLEDLKRKQTEQHQQELEQKLKQKQEKMRQKEQRRNELEAKRALREQNRQAREARRQERERLRNALRLQQVEASDGVLLSAQAAAEKERKAREEEEEDRRQEAEDAMQTAMEEQAETEWNELSPRPSSALVSVTGTNGSQPFVPPSMANRRRSLGAVLYRSLDLTDLNIRSGRRTSIASTLQSGEPFDEPATSPSAVTIDEKFLDRYCVLPVQLLGSLPSRLSPSADVEKNSDSPAIDDPTSDWIDTHCALDAGDSKANSSAVSRRNPITASISPALESDPESNQVESSYQTVPKPTLKSKTSNAVADRFSEIKRQHDLRSTRSLISKLIINTSEEQLMEQFQSIQKHPSDPAVANGLTTERSSTAVSPKLLPVTPKLVQLTHDDPLTILPGAATAATSAVVLWRMARYRLVSIFAWIQLLRKTRNLSKLPALLRVDLNFRNIWTDRIFHAFAMESASASGQFPVHGERTSSLSSQTKRRSIILHLDTYETVSKIQRPAVIDFNRYRHFVTSAKVISSQFSSAMADDAFFDIVKHDTSSEPSSQVVNRWRFDLLLSRIAERHFRTRFTFDPDGCVADLLAKIAQELIRQEYFDVKPDRRYFQLRMPFKPIRMVQSLADHLTYLPYGNRSEVVCKPQRSRSTSQRSSRSDSSLKQCEETPFVDPLPHDVQADLEIEQAAKQIKGKGRCCGGAGNCCDRLYTAFIAALLWISSVPDVILRFMSRAIVTALNTNATEAGDVDDIDKDGDSEEDESEEELASLVEEEEVEQEEEAEEVGKTGISKDGQPFSSEQLLQMEAELKQALDRNLEKLKPKAIKTKHLEVTEKPLKSVKKSRRVAPDWQTVVDLILTSIKTRIAKLASSAAETVEDLHMEMTASNVAAIFNLCYSFCVLLAVSFAKNISWGVLTGLKTVFGVVLFESNSSKSSTSWFKLYFWVAFAFALLYPFAAVPALNLAKQGRLGQEANGTPAKFPSKMFFFTNFLSFVGSTLYVPIIKTLLQAVSCDYSTTTWTLYKDTDIVCWESTHMAYVMCAALGLLAYYPISTFVSPNLQFRDKSLDLKFDTSFLIIAAQLKLIISSIVTFFPQPSQTVVALSVSCVLFCILALVCIKMQPCLVKRANYWISACYIAISWACVSALLGTYMDDTTATIICLCCGWTCIFAACAAFYTHDYGMCCCRRKRRLLPMMSFSGTGNLQAMRLKKSSSLDDNQQSLMRSGSKPITIDV